jgi:hypothetical protein
MQGTYWEIDGEDVRTLTPALRTWLANNHGWVNVPAHTHAALVNVREVSPTRTECLVTFVFSLTASAYTGLTADLEDAIAAEVRTRLRALRNAQPLSTIVNRRHWL